MKTDSVYRFRVALKHRRGLWRVIEVRRDQKLGELDVAIREAFKHDLVDHLSEFYTGKVWRSVGYGETHPGGGGPGGHRRIGELALSEGDQMEYVYDFGDDIQHVVTLEKVMLAEANQQQSAKYPRVVAQNRPRYRYCVVCQKAGEKEVATNVCIDCSNRGAKPVPVFLCEDCTTEHPEDHFIDEVLY